MEMVTVDVADTPWKPVLRTTSPGVPLPVGRDPTYDPDGEEVLLVDAKTDWAMMFAGAGETESAAPILRATPPPASDALVNICRPVQDNCPVAELAKFTALIWPEAASVVTPAMAPALLMVAVELPQPPAPSEYGI